MSLTSVQDRAQAAQRLLDDPLAKEILDSIESDAIEAMLKAPDDQTRRECRDTILVVRKFRSDLKQLTFINAEQKRTRPAVA